MEVEIQALPVAGRGVKGEYLRRAALRVERDARKQRQISQDPVAMDLGLTWSQRKRRQLPQRLQKQR